MKGKIKIKNIHSGSISVASMNAGSISLEKGKEHTFETVQEYLPYESAVVSMVSIGRMEIATIDGDHVTKEIAEKASPKKEEPKKVEPKKEDPKKEEPKKEEPKKAASKK